MRSCDDGLYCNGNEVCDPVTDCQFGVSVDCGHLNDQCNDGMCDETSSSCVAQSVPDGDVM